METGRVVRTAPGDDPCWWSVRQVATAIRQRTIAAREYLDLLVARVERYNPDLGLVVTIDERAVAAAKAADDAVVRGEIRGPMHGVAMTVKDSMATAGLRTTGGMPELAAHVPH